MATKSLGTLTLDLVAKVGGFVGGLDKSERASEKWRRTVEKEAKAAGVAIGAGVATGLAALTAMTIGTVNAAGELSRFAQVSGSSTNEFQRYAAGAKTVGIEQEKLADIFKDTNDKVGDFLTNGGGELQDFFKTIAPKVGVTADQFRNLSGPQALQLFASTLDKAGLSQAEMTTQMEALANDATLLLPLLRNNGEGFRSLGDAAAEVGAILDDKTIKSANELKAVIWLVEQSTAGLKNQLVSQLIPVLGDFAVSFGDVTKNGTSMVAVGEFITDTLKFIAKSAVGAVAAFDLLGKGIAAVAATAAAGFQGVTWQDLALGPIGLAKRLASNWDGMKLTAAGAADDLQSTVAKYAGLIESINNAGTGQANGKIKELADLLAKLREQGNKPGTFKGLTAEQQAAGKAAEAAQKKLQGAFDSSEEGYERQIALINTEVDKRKDATEVAKLQFEIESGKLVGINSLQQERLKGLATELDRLKKLKQANEDAAKAAAFGGTLTDANQTAASGFAVDLAGAGQGDKARERARELLSIQQDFAKQQSDLQKQYNGGDISKELYDTETGMLKNALAERLDLQNDYYAQLDEAQANWMDGVNDAFQNYVDSATDYNQQAADAVTEILGAATSSVSDGLYDLVTGAESVRDAFGNIATAIGQTIVKALADMAAQWLVLQAVQLVTGKATQLSAATALSANAQATAIQAGLAAFASTAAIPIVGPVAAPAAMAAALAVAEPMAAAVATFSLAGMAHDGIDAVPETGTWLLQKGERVTTAETSAKLDGVLNDIRGSGVRMGGGAPITVNFDQRGINDPKQMRDANASTARQVARAIRNAQRYT